MKILKQQTLSFIELSQFGSTATVLYKLYKENGMEIDPKIAGLMLSSIISDTLLFKSPICTKVDIDVANELSKIANVDVHSYGLDMLKAGTDLSDLTAEELISIDSKEFMFGTLKSEVAQINTASIPDMLVRLAEIKERMNARIDEKNLELFVVAITDVIENNSQIIALGRRSDLVEKAYEIKLENDNAFLPGVVSRKKQIVPILTRTAEN